MPSITAAAPAPDTPPAQLTTSPKPTSVPTSPNQLWEYRIRREGMDSEDAMIRCAAMSLQFAKLRGQVAREIQAAFYSSKGKGY
jgi:hypothetical protein